MKQTKQTGFAVVEGLLILVIIGLIGGIGFYVMNARSKSNKSLNSSANNTSTIKIPSTSQQKVDKLEPASAKPTPTAAATAKKTTPTSTAPTTPTPTTTPASTNCGQSTDDNNMALLNANSYSSTKKMHDAIEFADLTSAVNSAKVTVIAPNDYVFGNLTKAQADYMNASPANMKSVIGWHIVTGCYTWSSQFSSSKVNITLNTLNGPVVWSPDYHGKVNGVDMAIYDFFSSNGVVHLITGFIKPPAL